MWEELLQWDKDAFVYLNGLGRRPFDNFWSTITEIQTWIPLFLFFIVLFFWKHKKQEALLKVTAVVLLAVFITFLTHWTKVSVARFRPNNDLAINEFIRILKSPVDYSFFSGHASSSFAITVLVFLFLRPKIKWVSLFFLWPLLFSYSRIYVGVHYPTDIIIGALVGSLSGLLFYFLYKKILAKKD